MKGDLVKLANRLDSLGLKKEADLLDAILRKMAGEGDADWDEYYRVREDFGRNKPASVEDQVGYFGNRMAEIEAQAKKSGNEKLVEWVQSRMASFDSAADGQKEFDEISEDYPDWKPFHFGGAYRIYTKNLMDLME